MRINSDGDIFGSHVLAYCKNNPMNACDSDGYASIPLSKIVIQQFLGESDPLGHAISGDEVHFIAYVKFTGDVDNEIKRVIRNGHRRILVWKLYSIREQYYFVDFAGRSAE